MLVTGSGHAHGLGPTLSFREAAALDLALPTRQHGLRGILESFARTEDVDLSPQFEMDSIVSIIKLVERTRYATLLPRVAVRNRTRRGRLNCHEVVFTTPDPADRLRHAPAPRAEARGPPPSSPCCRTTCGAWRKTPGRRTQPPTPPHARLPRLHALERPETRIQVILAARVLLAEAISARLHLASDAHQPRLAAVAPGAVAAPAFVVIQVLAIGVPLRHAVELLRLVDVPAPEIHGVVEIVPAGGPAVVLADVVVQVSSLACA